MWEAANKVSFQVRDWDDPNRHSGDENERFDVMQSSAYLSCH